MIKLNIGCGHDLKEGFVNIDFTRDNGADLDFDLETCRYNKLPFEDNSVVEIHAAHVLEHVTDILPLMQELHRVAMHNCLFKIWVPAGRHDSALEDPTHVRFFTHNSFWYYSQVAYARADYGYRGDWDTKSITAWVKLHIMQVINESGVPPEFAFNHFNNIIDEFEVVLGAVKPIRSVTDKFPSYPPVKIEIAAEDSVYEEK